MLNWIRLLVPLIIVLVLLIVALVVVLWLAKRCSDERATAQTLETHVEEDPNRIVVPVAPPASVVESPEPEELMLDQLVMAEADAEVKTGPEIEPASVDEEPVAECADLIEEQPTEPAAIASIADIPEDAISLGAGAGQPSPVVEVEPVAEPLAPAPDLVQSQPDDLRRIEGIGAKISQLLIESGLRTYADLAVAEVEMLRGLLRSARIGANPTTWPEQAALAAEARWEELATLQATLTGGRRT